MEKVALPAPALKKGQINEKAASLILKNVKLAFVSLDKPRPNMQQTAYLYEATVLIPKKNQKIVDEILKIGGKLVKDSPKFSDAPGKKGKPSEREQAMEIVTTIGEDGSLIKDGDETISKSTEKPYDGCENMYTLKLKAHAEAHDDGTFSYKQQVKFVFADLSELRRGEIATELYSGAWVDVSFALVPYNYMGSVGVTAYLNGVQKLVDDAKLGGFNPFEDRSEEVAGSAEEGEDEDDDEESDTPNKY